LLDGSGIAAGKVLRLDMPGLGHKRIAHVAHIFIIKAFLYGLGQHACDGRRRNSQTGDIPCGLKTLQGQPVRLLGIHGCQVLLNHVGNFSDILF
jgi:hypothetical protein